MLYFAGWFIFSLYSGSWEEEEVIVSHNDYAYYFIIHTCLLGCMYSLLVLHCNLVTRS